MLAEDFEVLQNLQNLIYYEERIELLESRLREITPKTTQTYSLTGFSGGGTVSSQVENLCIQKESAIAELQELRKTVAEYYRALENCKLTQLEKTTLTATVQGVKMSKVAKREGLYKSYVYKVRDRAIRKLRLYLFINNTTY